MRRISSFVQMMSNSIDRAWNGKGALSQNTEGMGLPSQTVSTPNAAESPKTIVTNRSDFLEPGMDLDELMHARVLRRQEFAALRFQVKGLKDEIRSMGVLHLNGFWKQVVSELKEAGYVDEGVALMQEDDMRSYASFHFAIDSTIGMDDVVELDFPGEISVLEIGSRYLARLKAETEN